MIPEADAIERLDFRQSLFELRVSRIVVAPVSIFPDKKPFVDRAVRVDFEFVIGVFSRDEDFNVVVIVDGVVTFQILGLHIRFGHPERDVQVFIVPQHAGACFVHCPGTADQIDKRICFCSGFPDVFVKSAVDFRWFCTAAGGVARDLRCGDQRCGKRFR